MCKNRSVDALDDVVLGNKSNHRPQNN
ncbi:hypothetical protein F01_580004 [Burkholderia cenocepacia]|nr:hypothetical protein F01_580004 [Burkholderia cenocepacia]